MILIQDIFWRRLHIILLLFCIPEVYLLSQEANTADSSIYGMPDSILLDTVISESFLKLRTQDTSVIPSLHEVITDSIIVDDSIEVIQDTSGQGIYIGKDTLTLVMVGDVMLGTNFPSGDYLPPRNDCWPLLAPVADLLSNADISFCNLEGSLAGTKGIPKNCKDPKTCYVFRMPEEYAGCIKNAGFDIVSVANNHVNDFGYEGRVNTKKVLEENKIHYAGFDDTPYTIFKSDELLIGFCAFSTNQGVMDLRDYQTAEKIVKILADTCDIVLVSMHGGAEGAKYQHVTKQTETFLGANRGNVYDFAHRMIDAGADVIMGHGPHVTRSMEIYKGRFIAYSLGNFATYARFNITGPNGIAPLVRIRTDREGRFLDGQVYPVQQLGEGGASVDRENKVVRKLQYLISLDFPESELKLADDGSLIRLQNEHREELP